MNYYMFSSSISDLSVAAFNDLVSSGAGGILILIPSSENLLKISELNRAEKLQRGFV